MLRAAERGKEKEEGAGESSHLSIPRYVCDVACMPVVVVVGDGGQIELLTECDH